MSISNTILRFIFLTATLMLYGCGGDACLDADDFGFAKMTVSSRYDKSEIFGDQTAEITPWRDKGLVLNGEPLYIVVKNWIPGEDPNDSGVVSAWCPWYGDKDHGSKLTSYCARLLPCNFIGSEKCAKDVQGGPLDSAADACLTAAMCTATKEAQIANPPCLMTKGVGLYALLAKPGYDPNVSLNTMSNPDALTMHMGSPHSRYYIPSLSNSGRVSNTGGVLYDYDGNHTINSSRIDYVKGRLYFKILDRFYEDNNGQYRIFIKSGVVNGGWDPISWCIGLVKKTLFGSTGADYKNGVKITDGGTAGIVPTIYSTIVANSGFTNTVRALLMLFIIFSAMGFIMGSIEITQKELIGRVIKIIIIIALISPNSWHFFNEHLFIWFYEGTDFVINILYEVAASGPGSSNPLDFFFSEEIFIKLFSLLLSTPTGWIYIIIYLIMLVFLVKIYFDAAVLYMTALIMVGLLISIAPIFIMFYIFEQTKSFFDNWVKQIMSYSVQMILVYAGILFMTMIIRNQIYNTLGFPTCMIEFPNIQGISIFKWPFPKISSTNPSIANIPVPKDHFKTVADLSSDSNNALGSTTFSPQSLSASPFCLQNPNNAQCAPGAQTAEFCSAYQCTGFRYPDLPFLDPNNPYENRLIGQMRSGYIGDFGGLAIILVCVYLMNHFNKTTVSMAQFLSSTTNNAGSNATAATAASAGLKSAIMAPVHAADRKLGVSAAIQAKRDSIKQSLKDAKYNIIDKPWADRKIKSLKEDAVKGGLKSVRKQAESITGMSHAEATTFNKNLKNASYAKDLEHLLQTPHSDGEGVAISSNVNAGAASRAIVGKLSSAKAEDFKNIAAQELFGKDSQYSSLKGGVDYSKLSSAERVTIDRLETDMKGMLDAKVKQDKYAEAYSESYLKMSDEGVGFLSKRSGTMRAASENLSAASQGFKEFKNVFNKADEDWNQSRLDKARKISKKTSLSNLLPDSWKEVDYKELYAQEAKAKAEQLSTKTDVTKTPSDKPPTASKTTEQMSDKVVAKPHVDRSGPGGQGASTSDPFAKSELGQDENENQALRNRIAEGLLQGKSREEILSELSQEKTAKSGKQEAVEADAHGATTSSTTETLSHETHVISDNAGGGNSSGSDMLQPEGTKLGTMNINVKMDLGIKGNMEFDANTPDTTDKAPEASLKDKLKADLKDMLDAKGDKTEHKAPASSGRSGGLEEVAESDAPVEEEKSGSARGPAKKSYDEVVKADTTEKVEQSGKRAGTKSANESDV